MALRLACVGFRHGHITSLYKQATELDYAQIVATVEEAPAAAASILESIELEPTYDSIDRMMDEVEFDVLMCGDYYSKRGQIAIRALEAGKHVLSDKPMCTDMADLERIKQLCEQNDLEIQIALTMRYGTGYQTLVKIMRDGGIGTACSAIVLGQHPLSYGSRPNWYFEEGKQGGTINDLFIHGTDMMRWATGQEFRKVIAAEAWNARADWAPFFQDSAQVVYEMSDGTKVMGDCSYLTPEGSPAPWQFFVWGTEGYVHLYGDTLTWQRAGEGEMPVEMVAEPSGGNCVSDFLSHLANGTERWLSMDDCFKAQMAALAGQAAADSGQRDMPVPVV